MNGSHRQPGRDHRGNVYDRRARRAWIVETFGVSPKRRPKGQAVDAKSIVLCHHCGKRMRAEGKAWQVDRFPVCGHAGGTYERGNIVPACASCNARRCGVGSLCRRSANKRLLSSAG